MTKSQVINAINSNNYDDLLEVYNKYKIDKKYDKFFAEEQNPDINSLRYRMLLARVREIYRKLEQNNAFDPDAIVAESVTGDKEVISESKPIVVKPLAFPKNTGKVVIDNNPHIHRDKLPEEMQVLYDENGKMNQEAKSKHALLNVVQSDAERKELMDQLCELEEKQVTNWAAIDRWYQDNIVDPKQPEPKKVLEPAEIAKKIDAAKNYIARYDGSKKPIQMAKLKEYKAFLTEMKVAIPKKMAEKPKPPEPPEPRRINTTSVKGSPAKINIQSKKQSSGKKK